MSESKEREPVQGAEELRAMLKRLPGGIEHLRYHVENVLYPKLAELEEILGNHADMLDELSGADDGLEFLTNETADEIDSVLNECVLLLTDVYPLVKEQRAALLPRFSHVVGRIKALAEDIDELREEEGEEEEGEEEEEAAVVEVAVEPVVLTEVPQEGGPVDGNA